MSSLVEERDDAVTLEAPPIAIEESGQYLTFLQQGEMFAIGILCIKEIMEYGKLTTVPLMPDFVSGVINIRGAVVPVIDLSTRFGRPSAEITPRSCIVIIETESDGERVDIGIIVDSVSEVLEIPPTEIEPAPRFGTNIRADFISGMGKVNDEFVIILDISRVLSVDEMSSLAGMQEESISELADI